MIDLNRFNYATATPAEKDEALLTIEDQFSYHPWDDDQAKRGIGVKEALANATVAILTVVPPCPDRSTALRKIREARMDCNSAITHNGRY